MTDSGDDASDGRPTVPLGTTTVDGTKRRRRRVWGILALGAVVTAVLAATVTVPGWQRTVALAVVVLGMVGLAAVKPLLRRAPKPADGDEKKVDWIAPLAGVSIMVVGELIRSVGPERGGWWAFGATTLAAALLVIPAQLALDACVRLRRARTHVDEADGSVNARPNPRP